MIKAIKDNVLSPMHNSELADRLDAVFKERCDTMLIEEKLCHDELVAALTNPSYANWLYNPTTRKAWREFQQAAKRREKLENAVSVVLAALGK